MIANGRSNVGRSGWTKLALILMNGSLGRRWEVTMMWGSNACVDGWVCL